MRSNGASPWERTWAHFSTRASVVISSERLPERSTVVNLADAKLGVIFNTTLAGTEPANKPPDPTNAGSRLIITNLAVNNQAFPTLGFPGADGQFLPYVVVQDPAARLTTGAALSANFPPVFSNARIDLKQNGKVVETHWVTDGGVAENRGDISLLYVLLDALKRENAAKKRVPRPVLIIIAEASGVSLDFSQDRGLGSMLGASGKFANQLMARAARKDPADLHVRSQRRESPRPLPTHAACLAFARRRRHTLDDARLRDAGKSPGSEPDHRSSPASKPARCWDHGPLRRRNQARQ